MIRLPTLNAGNISDNNLMIDHLSIITIIKAYEYTL